MSVEQAPSEVSWSAQAAKEASRQHPLSPLTTVEIRAAAELVKSIYLRGTELLFKQITLEEPEKVQLAPWLDAKFEGKPVKPLDRKAFVSYYIRNTDKFFEAVVDLKRQHVESNLRLGPNKHGNGDGEEIVKIEKIALENEAVKAEIAKLKLPEGTQLICDPWIYGSDGIDDDRRLYQCFMYMRDPTNSTHADSNHYALPLPISPVVDTEQYTVIRVDIMPTGSDHTIKPVTPYKIQPPNEYTPEHQQLRTDIKPLHVVQPEGASFHATSAGESGEYIAWQKWTFFIGFNAREGMVLYDIRYDGRPLFHRLSLSDMSIPYADPRHPFHKKQAFDLGDAGAGGMANNLSLGCDCLGSIHYLSAVLADPNGDPLPMPNVICVHEQDAGIGWKHTNYRTGRAAVVRNRELVVQSIITVSNYEYILAFNFNQAAGIEYEVRATGILSTQPVDEGVDVPWGTVVHPGVLAVHHQHIFSLRVDPMVDGRENRLVYEEALAMPRGEFNPHGVGYYTQETLVERSAGLDLETQRNRTFKIQNVGSRNGVNGKPVAYKIHAPDFQKILADADSFHFKRAAFADHNVYVTPHRDGEVFSAGRYTNQSRGDDDGVRFWAKRNENVVDTDIVVWVQFGINHIPRIEDFPVMPVEIIKVGLKPVNFFDRNPAIDVPPSRQEVNRSVEVAVMHGQPPEKGEGRVDGKGECCGSKL